MVTQGNAVPIANVYLDSLEELGGVLNHFSFGTLWNGG